MAKKSNEKVINLDSIEPKVSVISTLSGVINCVFDLFGLLIFKVTEEEFSPQLEITKILAAINGKTLWNFIRILPP